MKPLLQAVPQPAVVQLGLAPAAPKAGSGFGLEQVRERLAADASIAAAYARLFGVELSADEPERALVKLRGFVADEGGQVIESRPGLIRVSLGEPPPEPPAGRLTVTGAPPLWPHHAASSACGRASWPTSPSRSAHAWRAACSCSDVSIFSLPVPIRSNPP